MKTLEHCTNEEIYTAVGAAEPLALHATIAMLTKDAAPEIHAQMLLPVETSSADGFPTPHTEMTDPSDIHRIRDAAANVLILLRDKKLFVPKGPFGDEINKFSEFALGSPIAPDEAEYWREELAIDPLPRALEWNFAPDPDRLAASHVLVIGAGMGGITAAVHLAHLGIPYTVIEKNDDVGGTWFQNRYPGARVDATSRFYSFSFEGDYPWRHHYAPATELKEYLINTSHKHGIRSNIRFRQEVVSAHWKEAEKHWNVRIRQADGVEYELNAIAIISAVGMHDRPAVPNIKGIERFKGRLFHTARWPSDLELTGKRMAVIGTGASALQLAPEVAPKLKRLTVFQRSPAWIVPLPHYQELVGESEQWLVSNLPYYVNFIRLQSCRTWGDGVLPAWNVDPEWKHPLSLSAANHYVMEGLNQYRENKLGDRPDLMEKATPKYPAMSKRFVADSGWYDTLRRDNVDLVTEAIVEITPNGVKTQDGVEHDCDIIVMACGFRQNDFLWPMHIEGQSGISIREEWRKDGARAFMGMMIPGFPNFFCLYGPNTNNKSGSPCLYDELQLRFGLQCIQQIVETGMNSFEITRKAYDDYNRLQDAELAKSIWMDPRQKSYYRNEHGRCAVNIAWGTIEYWKMTRKPNTTDFNIS